MDDGQLWFGFAWSAAWAAAVGVEPPETAGSGEKKILKGGLSQVISISPAGTETGHWQCRSPATARRLAERLAARLPAGERVIVRRTVQVVTRFEVDDEVPPPGAA